MEEKREMASESIDRSTGAAPVKAFEGQPYEKANVAFSQWFDNKLQEKDDVRITHDGGEARVTGLTTDGRLQSKDDHGTNSYIELTPELLDDIIPQLIE